MGNLIMTIVSWSMSVVFYVISAICLYKLGKRREIKNRGLVWIPFFGYAWMLGSVADHYDRWKTGKDHRFRIWMVIGMAVTLIADFAMLYMSYWMTVNITNTASPDAVTGMLWWLLLMIVLLVLLIGVCVLQGFAMYRTYYSCRPKKAALLTVMSLVFAIFSIGPIVCLLCAYKKDEGFDEAEIIDPEAERKRLELYN